MSKKLALLAAATALAMASGGCTSRLIKEGVGIQGHHA